MRYRLILSLILFFAAGTIHSQEWKSFPGVVRILLEAPTVSRIRYSSATILKQPIVLILRYMKLSFPPVLLLTVQIFAGSITGRQREGVLKAGFTLTIYRELSKIHFYFLFGLAMVNGILLLSPGIQSLHSNGRR